ncbi:carbon-phosphorus lyase complex subunit PhnI [candidate division NPL-UPA2 bacterium]|nr:carbon-phosphorus lyase complex subunit PhnI [candidate division NPL-UPA2 bacterium]
MGYVAVRGGLEAIENAERLVKYFRVKGDSRPIEVKQICEQFRLAVDQVMAEGSLYAPLYAATALKQAEGDTIEASFILRALGASLPRNHYAVVADTREMEIIRRISAAFKDIPGGQILGPTRDYTQRLLDFSLMDEEASEIQKFKDEFLTGLSDDDPPDFPKIVEILRQEGLLEEPPPKPVEPPVDITREALKFPAPRSARLQVLARGERGGMLAIAYSSMRGYGNIHPALGELRVGYLPLRIRHPWGEGTVYVGRVQVTEAEVISVHFTGEKEQAPKFTLGYGLCFGHNEIKAISMAVLDRTLRSVQPQAPAEDEEFVLYHIDGIESSGFASHWKLPHYVTFQSDLDRIREARKRKAGKDD